MEKNKKIIAIVGPTATGKTELAIKIAKKLHTYIISGDSMQIYRHFHIGTAQPDLNKITVPYYLVNLLEPETNFSAYDFKEKANAIINTKSTIPIIAGGTGFYINSFLRNDTLGYLNSAKYHQFIHDNADKSEARLKEELFEVDPQAYHQIDINNPRRVLRALAIKRVTNMSILDQKPGSISNNVYLIGLNTDRSRLYQRIETRVDLMIKQGLLEEAKRVYQKQMAYPLLSKAIAYKEFFDYFSGKQDLETAINLLKQKTRNYAKRQLTWFHNKMSVNWYDFNCSNFEEQVLTDLYFWLIK